MINISFSHVLALRTPFNPNFKYSPTCWRLTLIFSIQTSSLTSTDVTVCWKSPFCYLARISEYPSLHCLYDTYHNFSYVFVLLLGQYKSHSVRARNGSVLFSTIYVVNVRYIYKYQLTAFQVCSPFLTFKYFSHFQALLLAVASPWNALYSYLHMASFCQYFRSLLECHSLKKAFPDGLT